MQLERTSYHYYRYSVKTVRWSSLKMVTFDSLLVPRKHIHTYTYIVIQEVFRTHKHTHTHTRQTDRLLNPACECVHRLITQIHTHKMSPKQQNSTILIAWYLLHIYTQLEGHHVHHTTIVYNNRQVVSSQNSEFPQLASADTIQPWPQFGRLLLVCLRTLYFSVSM